MQQDFRRALWATIFVATASGCASTDQPVADTAGRPGTAAVSGAQSVGGSTGEAGSSTPPSSGKAGSASSAGGSGNTGASGGGGATIGAGTAGASSVATGQIWMPKPGVTWQWQLSGALDTSVDAKMYDIDLFASSAATIQALHDAGRTVVCYFSAGSYEPDRPDSSALEKTGLGSVLDGWPDEKWLDIRSAAVRDIMKARLDLAKSKACDGVEPDNVDGYDNENGLGLTQQDQLDYNTFLATESHNRKLSIGLKNTLGLVSKLVSTFDWALNEECLKYNECSMLTPFISASKAVFHCEYAKTTSGICNMQPQGFSTIIKNMSLDAFRLTCP